jgi:hypothetical protein
MSQTLVDWGEERNGIDRGIFARWEKLETDRRDGNWWLPEKDGCGSQTTW